MRVQIPTNITEARSKLADVDVLLTATQWEKAAIVWAFTERPGSGSHNKQKANSSFLSFSEFAALGIVGLKSKDTVARYHDAWQAAIDAGKARPVKPGQTVTLPDLEWPYEPVHIAAARDRDEKLANRMVEMGLEDGVSANLIAKVAEMPGIVAAAIKADRRIAERAAAALAGDAQGRIIALQAVQANTISAPRPPLPPRQRPQFQITDIDVLRHGRYVLAALIAMEEGTYSPSPQAALILAALRPSTDWDAELTTLGRG